MPPLLIIIILITMFPFLMKYKVHKPFITQIGIPGKLVIITGANSGIGYETAKELSKRGGRVILACRDLNKAQKAAADIQSETGNDVIAKHLDLSSFKSILAFSKDIIQTMGKVDILINNASTGILDNSLTEDGLPIEAQINHFGPFLLTNLLLPVMKNLPEPARIINVTSLWHVLGKIKNFNKQGRSFLERRRVYPNTKLANLLFTQKLAEEVKNDNIIVNSCHPGAVYSVMYQNRPWIQSILECLLLTPEQGAQTTIFLACRKLEAGALCSGRHYSNCEEATPGLLAHSRKTALRLWNLSLKCCEGYLDNGN